MSLRKFNNNGIYQTLSGSESARLKLSKISKDRNAGNFLFYFNIKKLIKQSFNIKIAIDNWNPTRFAKTSLGIYKSNIEKKTSKPKPCVSTINKYANIYFAHMSKSYL